MIHNWNDSGIYREVSPKQRAVLELLAQNLTSKEIARELSISHHAVEQRIQTIRAKFGRVPRGELVRLYSQLDLEFRAQAAKAASACSSVVSPERPMTVDSSCSGIAENKQKFFLGFFAGFSLGLLIALASVFVTYSLGAHTVWS